MALRAQISFIFALAALAPASALAWWEATLQQVDVVVTLEASGEAHIAYDLRYHVDRGRFEGANLDPDGRRIEWRRPTSYIQDARGRRFPVSILHRGRDGVYMVRLARGDGLRRGWVTIHLEYEDDLMDCCLRLDPDGRPRLDWQAFSWEVGMDRINITFQLAPEAQGLEPDEATAQEYEVEQTPHGLVVERIRPVRWYRAQVGLWLPRDWLERRPEQLREDTRPSPEAEVAPVLVTPPPTEDPTGLAHNRGLWFMAMTLLCLLLLVLKSWATAHGYDGRDGVAPPLLLPKVPPTLRWTVVVIALAAGGWLQSSTFLAAGTLAVVAGLLLTLRGPSPRREEAPPLSWNVVELETLEALGARRSQGRRRWAAALDGTAPAGFVPALVLFGATGAIWWSTRPIDTMAIDALAMDLALTLAAVTFTGRRRDLLPSRLEGAAKLLSRAARKLPSAPASDDEAAAVVQLGHDGDEAAPVEVRLTLRGGHSEEMIIATEPRLGLSGWSLELVARVPSDSGQRRDIRARRPGALVRRLRKSSAGRSAANPSAAADAG